MASLPDCLMSFPLSPPYSWPHAEAKLQSCCLTVNTAFLTELWRRMIFRIFRFKIRSVKTMTRGSFRSVWQQRRSLRARQAAWLHRCRCVTLRKNTTYVTQCWKGWNCVRHFYVACLPCECWSRGLGGGPIPLWPPCLIDSPFIWLKRLSSLMLFSCMLSMGCGKNSRLHI